MSGYSGGGASLHDNILKSWLPSHLDSVNDVDRNLNVLRDRAYDLYCNNAVGAAAINTMTSGVIGEGLKLYPKINFKALGMTAEAARAWSQRTKLEFEIWAKGLDCDFYRRNNFYELQRICFQSYLVDGDCFCLFRRRAPNPYTLRLQLIEAARVSNPLTSGGLINNAEMLLENNHRVINGVEISKDGRLMAVWVSNRIWNSPSAVQELSWRRVAMFGEETGCRNVLQICYDVRTEQYRGVPLLAPAIRQLKQVARYGDAELAASIIRSYFSLFFVQPTSNFDFNDILPEDKDAPVVDPREYKLGAGSISALPRGVDVKAIDKSNAQSTFEQFINSFVKQIGAAIGLPYEVLMKNFQSSYSASKAALIEAEREFKRRRQAFINDFCQPVYEMFLTEAVATGQIEAAGYFDDPVKRASWLQADFRNEQNHQLDPVKEVKASIEKINAGLSTRAIESSYFGTDFEENIEELRVENGMMSDG